MNSFIMKKYLLLPYFAILAFQSIAQNNIGIGTTTPSTRLHVKGTGAGTQILLEENGGSMLRLSNEGTTNGPYIGTTSNHKFSFVTNNTMKGLFETNGNFGIGVASAQKPLSVGGGAVIDQNNNNSGNSSHILSFGSQSAEGIGSNRTSANNQYGLDFYTAGNKRFSIKNDGKIGIGTDDPRAVLDIWTGDFRSIQFKNDLVPTIVAASEYGPNDGLAGIIRLKNAIEVHPNEAATKPGKIDVRNTAGTTTISMDGGTGKISAANMPAFSMKEGNVFLNINGNSTQNVTLLEANVNFPSTGVAHITAHCFGVNFRRNNNPTTPSQTTLEFKLDLYDAGNAYISTLKKQELSINGEYEIPVIDVMYPVNTPGNYILKYTLYKTNYGPEGWLETSKIIVGYYPNALSMN